VGGEIVLDNLDLLGILLVQLLLSVSQHQVLGGKKIGDLERHDDLVLLLQEGGKLTTRLALQGIDRARTTTALSPLRSREKISLGVYLPLGLSTGGILRHTGIRREQGGVPKFFDDIGLQELAFLR
jgi:hypothetical protein